MDLIEKTTFVIKSFMRSTCLDRLIQSIRDHYPNANILVADDGPEQIERSDASVFNLPFDTGLSYGRNFLVDRVRTDYFVLMDDDHVFQNETAIEQLLEPLETGLFDLVGAQVCEAGGPFPWEGLMEVEGTCLTMYSGTRGTISGVHKVDFCHNFFAAKTGVIQRLRWDDNFKLGEHTDFFLRAKIMGVNVGFCPNVRVYHAPEKSGEYALFRQRAKTYRMDMMHKHGLRKIVNHVFPGGNLDLDTIRE